MTTDELVSIEEIEGGQPQYQSWGEHLAAEPDNPTLFQVQVGHPTSLEEGMKLWLSGKSYDDLAAGRNHLIETIKSRKENYFSVLLLNQITRALNEYYYAAQALDIDLGDAYAPSYGYDEPF